MARLSKNQTRALAKLNDAVAAALLPRPLARRIMEAISIAIPSDGHRFFQIEPRTLLISRLLDASANDLDPRNEWLGDVYLRSGALRYIEIPEQMRSGVTALALQERQDQSYGLKPAMLENVTPNQHYELFHELRSPTGGTIFGTFHANGLWIAALQAYRRDDAPSFRATEVEFLRLIGGTIGNAVAASLGRERALMADSDAPDASGLLLIDADDRTRPLTPASERWLDLLRDPGDSSLSSAILAARAALRSNPDGAAGRLIAPSATGPVRIEASHADAAGGVAIVITPAGITGPVTLPPEWSLTARERDIALLVIQGLENTQVAKRLFVSPATVNWHLSNVYEKLAVDGRSGLIARFFKDVVFPGVTPFELGAAREV
ncbi:MAG: helix-turn-helix transcriptional regulator [Thermomicrobiales bacterium]|nr:helix-turn-helix transcriptional regulator [Thermomicrobiales bacterium]